MFDVYIKNYQQGQSIISTETLMFTIPSAAEFPITRGSVKMSEDSSENFSFTIESNSPYYDALLPLKTLFRIEYDGDIIFYGRIMSIQTSTVYQTKNITCAGYYTFMNDTYYEGKSEKCRQKISVDDYFTKIIENHNTADPSKAITRGTVGVTLPTELEKYEPSGWSQTSSLVSNLASNNGGHMCTRYEGLYPTTPTVYLDWYKYYNRDLGDGLRPSVVIGKNILDISSDNQVDNVFTRVIPIGDTSKDGTPIYVDGYKYKDKNNVEHTFSGKYIPVSLMRDLYTDEQLNDDFHNAADYSTAETDFGIIYKTMSFSDADKQEKLWNFAKKWIKECYFGVVPTFTVKAIDMHLKDNTIPKIKLGECVDVTYLIKRNGSIVWETKKLVCKGIQYDLFSPENTSYTFGVPSDLLEHNSDKKKSSKKKDVSAGTGSGPSVKTNDENPVLTWTYIGKTLIALGEGDEDYEGYDAYVHYSENGEQSGSIFCYDPDDIYDGAPLNHLDLWFNATTVGKITIPGKSVKWVGVSSERGVFAYVCGSNVVGIPVTHWYTKYKGYSLQGAPDAKSTFEDIAKVIEKDTAQYYGGTAAANSFRANGKLSGSVKVYDPTKTNDPAHNLEYVITAEIIGKITNSTPTKFVAMSTEFGTFAYTHHGEPEQIRHWYKKVKGATYDNYKALIDEESSGDSFGTTDGSPESPKTLAIQPTALTGYGSEGQIKLGYDLTSQEPKWKIKLNYPVQYTNADGETEIADGFVTADDFSVQTIPSFKTKLGIFDVVIAGKVDAAEIAADIAYVRQISGNVIVANTAVSSDRIYANRVSATTYAINVPSSGGGGYDTGYLNNCFSSCLVSESNGYISLTFGKIGGGTFTTGFNMASTRFYMDAVEAAYVRGGKTAYLSNTGATLNPGGFITVNAYYVGYDGSTGQRPVNSAGRPIETTIRARELRLRHASVTPTVSGQTVTPGYDPVGNQYDGLSYVIIQPISLEDKGTIAPTGNVQTITPSSGYSGISQVKIGAIRLRSESVSPSTSSQTILPGDNYDGLSFVFVRAMNLEDKGTVSPTSSVQTFTPSSGYDGISQIKVRALNLQDKGTVGATGSTQTFTPSSGYDGISQIKVRALSLEDKGTIDPTTEEQTFTPGSGYDGISQLKIRALRLRNASVTPTVSGQTVTPGYDPVGNRYDGLSYVIVQPISLEDKGTIAPTGNVQTITPSSGYSGISQVKIGAIRLRSESVSPSTSSQTILPGDNYDGLSFVFVRAMNLEDKGTVDPTTSAQTFTPGSGYDGISQIKVRALNLEDKGTVNPTSSTQTITPGSGYDGISQIKIGAAPSPVVHNDDIQIGSYNNYNTGTILRTLKMGILQAIENHTYVSFKVTVEGTSASKQYYMDFTTT